MSDRVQKNEAAHRGYLGGQAGAPVLRRTDPEYDEYETGYSQGGFYAGYDRVLLNHAKKHWLAEGSLRLQADYYRLSGDEGNLGSHKQQFSTLAGWKQRFAPLVFLGSDQPFWFFLDPMIGLGVADNDLNFGRGFPLEQETSFNFVSRLGGGAEYCFHHNACLILKGGYDLERSLAGIGYFQRGWRVGPELEVDFFGASGLGTDACWLELNDLREDLSACKEDRRKIYEEIAGLHGQTRRLFAENIDLNKAVRQQVVQYRSECMDPGIPFLVLEKNPGALEPFPPWEESRGECGRQVSAAKKALGECQSEASGSVFARLSRTRNEMAEKLPRAREVQAKLVEQFEEVIRWIYRCRKPGRRMVRTPKSILLFANANPYIFTQSQEFFNQGAGRIHPDLDDWIVYLNQPENKKVRIRLHGYANDTGSKRDNLSLSQWRVRNVTSYLTKDETGRDTGYGPTMVPAAAVEESQRSYCIQKTPAAGLSDTYCAIELDEARIDFARGYGSDPRELKKLHRRLKELGVVLTEADPEHPVYRMVWLELSDEEGNFQ